MRILLTYALSVALTALPVSARRATFFSQNKPNSLPLTVTLAKTAGTFSAGVTSLATAAYSQASGHCIAVIANKAATTAAMSVSDTAGNTFAATVPQFDDGGGRDMAAWTVVGTLGNASNVVTVAFGESTSFATVTYYDIGGTCKGVDLGAHAISAPGGSTSIPQTVTTAFANEAIITSLFQQGASLASATPPTGFTAGSVVSGFSLSASAIVSTIQSGVTLSWTSVSASSSLDMLTLSFHQ